MVANRKGWFIKQSFTDDFVDFMKEMCKKYPDKLFQIQGIANEHMDLVQFSKSFFKSASVADVSIDGNANIKERGVQQYKHEHGKALMKLNSLYLMYKWVKKYYKTAIAQKAIEKVVNGELFINDMTQVVSPYCYCFALSDLLARGMDFFKGNMNIGPPKRSESFIALTIQTVAYISNQIAGAAAFSDFFVCLDWFYRREFGDGYVDRVDENRDKIKNQFQNLIYSLCFPFRGSESLRGDQEIIVDGRTVPIGDFVDSNLGEDESSAQISGHWTYSFNTQTGKYEKKKIKAVIRHNLSDDFLVEYKTVLGQTLACTAGHSLFTRRDMNVRLVTADDKDVPENVIVPFNFVKEHETMVSTIPVPQVGGRLPIDNITLTPEMMYLMGQYIGDGNIGGSRLKISTFNDKVNEKISSDLDNTFRCHVTKRNELEVSLGINVSKVFTDVFGVGSRGKRIPRNWCYESNILHLIGGYIDADGHARQDKGDMVLSSVNKPLLEDVQFILLSRGIVSKISDEINTQGFGKQFSYWLLRIPAFHAHRLNEFLCIKKVPKKERLNYERQVFDFDGLYQHIMNNYNIRGLAENGIVSARGRDKSMTYDDVVSVVDWLSGVLMLETESDEDYMKQTLCRKYRNGSSNDPVIVSVANRKSELKDCLDKLSPFLTAVPIRLESVVEIDSEEFVYDISVEGNENFLTASNIYAHNSPFTNLSVMDSGFLEQLFGSYTYPDGTKADLDSVKKLSQMFLEYFSDIQSVEGVFTFPVMTIAISVNPETGEYYDPDFVDWAAKANCKKSVANIFQSPPNAFSSCCRLVSNLDDAKANGYQNSFGVGGIQVGSHRVAGLNLPRIAELEKKNPDILEEDLDILHKILVAHRRLIQRRIDDGSLPLYTHGWMSLRRQYSTIGFIGGYEYVVNKGLDIKTQEGVDSLKRVLRTIEDRIAKWQHAEKDDGYIYNIEQIPGEAMAVRLAEIDTVLGYNKRGWKLYSNQYLPLIEDASIYDRFRIQGEIDNYTSGGAILHLNVDDEKPLNEKQFRKIIEHAKQSGTVYFAVNYAYSECKDGHFSVGKHNDCPICKEEIVQQYTRVVGFITPTKSWNKTRRDYEYDKRVFYSNGRITCEDTSEKELAAAVA